MFRKLAFQIYHCFFSFIIVHRKCITEKSLLLELTKTISEILEEHLYKENYAHHDDWAMLHETMSVLVCVQARKKI